MSSGNQVLRATSVSSYLSDRCHMVCDSPGPGHCPSSGAGRGERRCPVGGLLDACLTPIRRLSTRPELRVGPLHSLRGLTFPEVRSQRSNFSSRMFGGSDHGFTDFRFYKKYISEYVIVTKRKFHPWRWDISTSEWLIFQVSRFRRT